MRGRKREIRGDEEKNRQKKEESREVTGLKPQVSTTQLNFESSMFDFSICVHPEAFQKQPFKTPTDHKCQ